MIIIIGYGSSVAPTYINEVSPVRLRGTLGASFQLGIVILLFVSQVISLEQVLGSEDKWHYALSITYLFRNFTQDITCVSVRFTNCFQRSTSSSTLARSRKSKIFAVEKEQSRRC